VFGGGGGGPGTEGKGGLGSVIEGVWN